MPEKTFDLNRRIELPDDFDMHGDLELARRICAAVISHQQGVSITTGYKRVMEDGGKVGDLWHLLAALATYLNLKAQNDWYRRLTTPENKKLQ